MSLIPIDGMMTSQPGGTMTMASNWQESMVEKLVTYTLELDGKFILVENVPARVNEETGEQFFSPSTVAHLQQLILDENQSYRVVETSLYSYVA
jgi:YgiT-type zinc finger domain-containing protein